MKLLVVSLKPLMQILLSNNQHHNKYLFVISLSFMKYFYAVVKILYYIMTIFVGVFFLWGELLFDGYYTTLLIYMIPWYLVLSGIMFGYIIGKLWLLDTEDESKHNSILLKIFILWTLLGVLLSLGYIFLK
jgi:hypothetical protein